MLTVIFSFALITSAQAVEPPCPATGSGPLGSAHYCTDANGDATCTLVMDIPFVGIIETTVAADSESECNGFVTASSNAPSTPGKNTAKSIRMDLDTPDTAPDFVDLNACTADLMDAQDRIEMIEDALGVPVDHDVFSAHKTSDGSSTRTVIESQTKSDPGDGAIFSFEFQELTLLSY